MRMHSRWMYTFQRKAVFKSLSWCLDPILSEAMCTARTKHAKAVEESLPAWQLLRVRVRPTQLSRVTSLHSWEWRVYVHLSPCVMSSQIADSGRKRAEGGLRFLSRGRCTFFFLSPRWLLRRLFSSATAEVRVCCRTTYFQATHPPILVLNVCMF